MRLVFFAYVAFIAAILVVYLAVPVVAYATMVAVIRKNWSDHQHHLHEEQERTGLRPQL